MVCNAILIHDGLSRFLEGAASSKVRFCSLTGSVQIALLRVVHLWVFRQSLYEIYLFGLQLSFVGPVVQDFAKAFLCCLTVGYEDTAFFETSEATHLMTRRRTSQHRYCFCNSLNSSWRLNSSADCTDHLFQFLESLHFVTTAYLRLSNKQFV